MNFSMEELKLIGLATSYLGIKLFLLKVCLWIVAIIIGVIVLGLVLWLIAMLVIGICELIKWAIEKIKKHKDK